MTGPGCLRHGELSAITPRRLHDHACGVADLRTRGPDRRAVRARRLVPVAADRAVHQPVLLRMPVVTRDAQRQVVGVITLPALLAGRLRDLQEGRDSERVLKVASLRQWRAQM